MQTLNVASRNCPSLYRGIVESNIDPERLGRCRIRVPSIHGDLNYPIDSLPWSRPLILSPVKKGRGSVNIPDIGDIVWVIFEGSNKDFPIYFGGTYAKDEIEIDNDIVDFYIEDEDRISYHRKNRTYDIKIGERHIIISPENITIKGDVVLEGNIKIKGSIESTEDITCQDVSFLSHVHGITAESDTTQEPRR